MNSKLYKTIQLKYLPYSHPPAIISCTCADLHCYWCNNCRQPRFLVSFSAAVVSLDAGASQHLVALTLILRESQAGA